MKKICLLLLGLSAAIANAQAPKGYYDNAKGKDGTALKNALYSIISGHTEYSYAKAYDLLMVLDEDPKNKDQVICIYSGFRMKKTDRPKEWNREHIWAKSYGDFGTKNGAGTDLHHLRAADQSTNSARNNRNFDEADLPYNDAAGKYKGKTSCKTTAKNGAWIWEPPDKVKGDIARMLFYMAVRYEGRDGEPDLEIVDTYQPKSSKKGLIGKLSALLAWHTSDPVDAAERKRNDNIFALQHNRNPFIDHPEYVNKIW